MIELGEGAVWPSDSLQAGHVEQERVASGRHRSSPRQGRGPGENNCFSRAIIGGWSGRCVVHHGAAMNHQLLEGAGLAVLGRPGFEFGVMGQEQVSHVVGILGVVLGTAGDEGLAILLEGDGVDRIEGDSSRRSRRRSSGRPLFQAEATRACG